MGVIRNNMLKNLRLSRFWLIFATSLKRNNMKKLILMTMMSLFSMAGFSQTETTTTVNASAPSTRFAYLSYDSVKCVMNEYAQMQNDMDLMRKEYEAEMKRVEDEFNQKYESFLDGQATFPKTILQKRQSELQEILNKNIEFKKESQRLLKETETEMLKDILATIDGAVRYIAEQRGYAFVMNSDESAVTFINPAMGDDITQEVKQLLTSK